QEHLGQCAGCQAALVKARTQQQLLGKAAKAEFPGVRFAAPAAATVLPLSTPVPKRAVKRSWMGRVATSALARAAAVLLVLGALAIPVGVGASRYADAENVITAQNRAIADARQKQTELSQAMAAIPTQRETDLAALESKMREHQVRVVVSGPETLQPGAPNQYDIQTFNFNDQLVKANLDLQIMDQDRHALFSRKNVVADNGAARVTLPADLAFKPNSKLSLEVVARLDGDKNAQAALTDELDLSLPVFVTHLTTDKPMYRPGETVFFRSLTLDRFTLKPPDEDFHLGYFLHCPNNKEVQVAEGRSQVLEVGSKDVGGKAIQGPDKKPLKGVGAGELVLNPDDPGGEYTLIVREANNRVPEQQRKFIVQQYELSPLNKELDFTRKTFGPGEEVMAKAKATRGDGKPVANQPVEATLNVDGATYDLKGEPTNQPLKYQTDADGVVMVRAKLPATIVRGETSLSVKFIDGKSTVDTITRPVPVLLKKLNVEFFPEGGYLVGGVSNRVYFQAKTTLGKPAELTGHVLGSDGQVVPSTIQTLNDAKNPGANQGMGAFSFTPKTGIHYELKIDTPTGIEGKYELPLVQDDGVTLTIPDGVTPANQPLRVILTSAKEPRNLLVGAYCRGRLLDHQPKTVNKGESVEVILNPAVAAGGVCRVTVFEEKATNGQRKELVPKVERLIYRQPAERLDLRVSADKKQYLPGDKVRLTLSAFDENGKTAPAVVLVKVVDKNVLTLADEKTARTMPTHFYLTSEVRKPEDLEFADFLLTDHAKAKEALDLLLGTQGWRRFAEQDPAKFRNDQREDAERLLVSIGQSIPVARDLTLEQGKRILEKFDLKQEGLQAELTEATSVEHAAKTDPTAMAAHETKDRYEHGFEVFRAVGLPTLGACLLLLGVLGLLLGFAKVLPRALPYAAASGVCGLLILGFVLIPWAGKQHMAAGAHREVAQNSAPAPAPEKAAAELFGAPADAKGEAKDRPLLEDNLEGAKAAPPQAKPAALGAVREAEAKKPAAVEKADDKKGVKEGDRDLMKKAGAGAGKMDNGAAKRKDGKPEQAQGNVFLKERVELRRELPQNIGRKQAELLKDLDRNVDGLAGFRQMPAGARAGGGARFADGDAFGGEMQKLRQLASAPAPLPPAFIVREFAHQHVPATADKTRADWTETLYWNPALVLPDGTGQVSFDLSDSLTTFEVAVAGHSLDGGIGAVKRPVVSKLPFSLTPTIPIEVTSSDILDVPVSIANNTNEGRSVQIKVDGKSGLKLVTAADAQLQLDPEGRSRRIFRMQPTLAEGKAELRVTGNAGGFDDAIERTFRIVPDGFPINGS
ncbi:MAG TPA: alpha-2-macroglobulin family protein, partial [Gemmataceae bacterium]